MLTTSSEAFSYLTRRLSSGCSAAEIGVFKGDFTEALLRQVKPSYYALIDPWITVTDEKYRASWYHKNSGEDMNLVYSGVRRRFSAEIDNNIIDIRRGHSTAILPQLLSSSFDFIFVDGDHTYEAVIYDLHESSRLLKASGLLLVDDYTAGGWWGLDVIRAVHDFLSRQSGRIRVDQVFPGQIALSITR